MRLSALNFLYYDEHILCVIAKAIGKSVKFDLTTAKLDQGNFPPICVEANLAKSVKRRV